MSDPEFPPLADAVPAPVVLGVQTTLADRLGTAWTDLISRWIASHVANSPISRNTEAYNHLVDVALPALRQAFEETI